MINTFDKLTLGQNRDHSYHIYCTHNYARIAKTKLTILFADIL